MKRIAIVVVVLALAAPWSAKAQQFDLSTLTCDKFMKADKDQMKLITAWLAGYYTDEAAAEVVDVTNLNKLQDNLVKFCTRETSFPIASAADGIFGQDGSASGDAPNSSTGKPGSGR